MTGVRDRLAILFGIWAVCVVVPPLQYLLGGPFDGSVTVTDAGLAVGLFVVATGSAKLGLQRVDDPARRFRKGIVPAGTLTLAGFVPLVGFVVAPMDRLVAAVPFGVGWIVGCISAFLIGYVADRAIVVESRDETDSPLTWSAKRRPKTGWIHYFQTGTAIVALGLVVWNLYIGVPAAALLWLLIGGFQFVQDIGRKFHRRQYEILDAGLVTTFGHLPWEDFDGYQFTDDDLILYSNVWPFGTVAYDRESVDDLEAVVDALDRYLPQIEGDHQEPSMLDNIRQEVLS